MRLFSTLVTSCSAGVQSSKLETERNRHGRSEAGIWTRPVGAAVVSVPALTFKHGLEHIPTNWVVCVFRGKV
ncbi:uncharacterized protein BP01DRAFT_72596 [Aspergillus saccharolyticus JOP 1030-1]|uniref:Uncharacterized protein n=1 Tax=Aspergillus saccharolyticus JOP 1030-1 TaxID=1450539 RepID=A0A319ASB5_9EURO|nr:hypothetical protein BP01DRAFT_72596 [Aspergillus saccharolyticus JOP 1030-1]PYH49172.1 hypothetical protein BP01DRAFT_72596 [Aspergillus saccharolyticus JOP 1030-1]